MTTKTAKPERPGRDVFVTVTPIARFARVSRDAVGIWARMGQLRPAVTTSTGLHVFRFRDVVSFLIQRELTPRRRSRRGDSHARPY